jgi:hypothetical protein
MAINAELDVKYRREQAARIQRIMTAFNDGTDYTGHEDFDAWGK